MERIAGWVLMLLLSAPGAGWSQAFGGIGWVNDDATLRVAGRTVHLFGIHIPETHETCHTFVRPVRCGPAAVLALEFRVTGFVHCFEYGRRADSSVEALCRVGADPFEAGEDLSEYMLRYGWAVALPYAPFEYYTLERIARHRGIGIWGIPVTGPP